MSVRAAVVAVLRRYDDEAWIVLASRGMLRRARKDLANLPVRVLAEDEEAVTLAVGARQVTLTPAGPTQATCTCSATETCQHIIVAGLWLVAQDDAAAPVPVDVPAAPAAPAAAPAAVAAALPTTAVVDPLHAELLAMTRDQLIAFRACPPSAGRTRTSATRHRRTWRCGPNRTSASPCAGRGSSAATSAADWRAS